MLSSVMYIIIPMMIILLLVRKGILWRFYLVSKLNILYWIAKESDN